MSISQWQEIHKNKIEAQVYERYRKDIEALTMLGFGEMVFTREVVFPYSAVAFFWLYPFLKLGREIFVIEKPLRYVLLNPMLLNYEYDTYAHVFAFGVKFVSLLSNEGILVSCNYPGERRIKPKKHIYRYAEKSSVAKAFEAHCKHIEELEKAGYETDSELCMPKFEAAMQRDDKIIFSLF